MGTCSGNDLVLVGVKIPAAWDPTFNLIAKANSGVAVFAAGLTLAAHKFEPVPKLLITPS